MRVRDLLILTFAALTLISIGRTSSREAPVVTVAGGQIRGGWTDSGGVVFKGIPYAQPPVGDLRWREPIPAKSWPGTRDATSFGAICPQNPGGTIPNAAQLYSEDCLYLNVWTADWPSKAKKPVFLWVHGGGNINGAASEARFDGELLAQRGIVVVTFNYRVGSFGFFSHPELTRESPHHASGNQGLLDQIAALQWVRRNIDKFGGDAGAITLGGSSAGAIDINALATSHLTKGLFRAIIGQSGPVEGPLSVPLTLPDAEKQWLVHTRDWGVPAGHSLAQLRAVPAAVILRGQPRSPMNVSVDGYVLREEPAKVFASGRQHRVALLAGSGARDFMTEPPDDLTKAIRDALGPLAPRALALYKDRDAIYGAPAVQWETDIRFRCPTVEELVWHAATGSPTFEYEFSRAPERTPQRVTLHGNEVSYVFGTLERGLRGTNIGSVHFTAVDAQLSEQMQQYWANFVKTGNPNKGNLPVWPAFDASSRAYLEFGDSGVIAKYGLRRQHCDVHMENTSRRITP